MLVRFVLRDIICMALWQALRGAGGFLTVFRGWSLRSTPGYFLATLRVEVSQTEEFGGGQAGNGQPTSEDAVPDGAWKIL
jgi:hypothetical protein